MADYDEDAVQAAVERVRARFEATSQTWEGSTADSASELIVWGQA